MGGSTVEDDWEITSPIQTLVLIGRTGNGKSATGNSILGRKAFKSMTRSVSVTSTCELQRTVLKDGQILNVIDTPGLFDTSAEPDFIGKEIVKCISMAKDGIHAVLLVLSVRNRFTQEEAAAISTLRTLFGRNINDYMIIVFTGGDELEENEESLDVYLKNCPAPLKEILDICGNRRVLFDNKTRDDKKKGGQVQELLSIVNRVANCNGGKPYTDNLFAEFKEGVVKLHDQTKEVDSMKGYTKHEISLLKEELDKAHEAQLKRITSMVESKLRDATRRLEQQLAEEQAARLKAEESAQAAQVKSNEEIRKLRENLERAQRETQELRKQAESGKCAIL